MNDHREAGTIKWFNQTKGFGFIQPDNGVKDVFVHIRQIEKAGKKKIEKGERVFFVVKDYKGKQQAEDLKFLT